MAVKIILKRKHHMKTFVLQHTLTVLGERVQAAESKGDNRLPVLALHSKLSEELKRLVI